MKNNIYRILSIVVLAMIGFCALKAQDGEFNFLESFEEGIPAELKASGKVTLDKQRVKYGNTSLKWEWSGNDKIVLDRKLGYHKQDFVRNTEGLQNGHGGSEKNPVLEPPRGFFVYIYNEKASAQRIRFQFGRGDSVDCEFDFNLNFTGWRTCVVGYDRGDMRGVPHPEMDRLTINAPATGSGTFFFDMLGTSVTTNPRTVNPNPQLPHIDLHPRLVAQYPHLLFEWSKYKPTFNLEPLSQDMITDFRKLESNVMDLIYPDYEQNETTEVQLESLKKKFNSFNITREGNQIYGAPVINNNIFKDYFTELKGTKDEIHKGVKNWRQDAGYLFLDIAKTYTTSKDDVCKLDCENMFIDLYDHVVDQGYDYGAGLGWVHHYSYVIREYAPAFFLMRDVLKKHDRLEEAIQISKWMYGFNQCYREDLVYGVEGRKAGNADEIQGFLLLKLVCALMMDDSPEKARDIKHYSSYYSNVFTAYSNALDETYKPDGTFFHHAGHAFGYGGRGVYGGVSSAYALSGTQYAQSEASYKRMRKVTEKLMVALFTEKLMAPKAFASIRFSNYELPEQFFQLPAVLACSAPKFDDEMGALYKDLVAKCSDSQRKDHQFWMDKVDDKMWAEKKYEYPKITQMPYSCVSLNRQQDDWMIAFRGHSKYVYPFESWGKSFFAYPLFIANGYLDVSYPSSLDGQTPDKGTWHAGYDWHRWPGVTSIQLPYKDMETNPGQVRDEGGEYLFSDQAFCGGVATESGIGVSVFQFKGHDKFGIRGFTGKKSYFFFDNKVLCLGTNITSDLADYEVETTLFQNALKAQSDIVESNEGEIASFPMSKTFKAKSTWIIDNRGTGYYILGADRLTVSKSNQTNPNYKGNKDVSGDFTTAYIPHGKAPKNAGYEYLLVADADKAEMTKLANQMKGRSAPIKVLQKDTKAHVVKISTNNATAFAVYAPEGANFKKGLVKSVNKKSTFVLKEINDKLVLSVADPDLNIYDGQEDLLPDGTRCELSIYEREWFHWPSRPTKVQITLSGNWNIEKQLTEMETADNKSAKIISSHKNETVIEFECKDGLSAEVLLSK